MISSHPISHIPPRHSVVLLTCFVVQVCRVHLVRQVPEDTAGTLGQPDHKGPPGSAVREATRETGAKWERVGMARWVHQETWVCTKAITVF